MKKVTKKRKKPYDSYTVTTGDIDLNIQHFNKCAGTDGGPLTETLDLDDMSKYDISFDDFQTIQARYLTYLNNNKEVTIQDGICDPDVMILTNRTKIVKVIKYWTIAHYLGWSELEAKAKKFLKSKVSEDEIMKVLDYYETKNSTFQKYAAACAVERPQQESINNSKLKKDSTKKSKLATENSSKNTTLNEAKRYVRRYYIRPQNIFCSNKTDVIQALIQFEDQDCSIYTLNNLGDEKDVTKLTNKDIIYYYDDGILYDKNHMKIMDYDLAIKHEEDRPNVDIDQTSDTKLSDIYQDRLTGWTDVEEAFNLHFDPVNAYGETLCEGKVINGICCICGEPIEGYGNNPEPVKSAEDGARCCDSCNLKFIIPARLDQWTENSNNEI